MTPRSSVLICLKKISLSNFTPLYRCSDVFCRSYSMYNTKYIEPIYQKSKLQELDEETLMLLATKPIKAPTNNQTCSVFHDPLLAKFTNLVMQGGKKSLAREIIAEAFEQIKRRQIRKYHLAEGEKREGIQTDPLVIFHEAIKKAKPLLRITHVTRGGIMYKVPIPIDDKKSTWQAMKWIITAAREHEPRRSHTGEYFSDRLCKELMDASSNYGKVIKKRMELHKLCEVNRAYSHYRWG